MIAPWYDASNPDGAEEPLELGSWTTDDGTELSGPVLVYTVASLVDVCPFVSAVVRHPGHARPCKLPRGSNLKIGYPFQLSTHGRGNAAREIAKVLELANFIGVDTPIPTGAWTWDCVSVSALLHDEVTLEVHSEWNWHSAQRVDTAVRLAGLGINYRQAAKAANFGFPGGWLRTNEPNYQQLPRRERAGRIAIDLETAAARAGAQVHQVVEAITQLEARLAADARAQLAVSEVTYADVHERGAPSHPAPRRLGPPLESGPRPATGNRPDRPFLPGKPRRRRGISPATARRP